MRADSVAELRLFTAATGKPLAVCGARVPIETEICVASSLLHGLHAHIHAGGWARLEARAQHIGGVVLSRQVSGAHQHAVRRPGGDRLGGNI